MSKKMGPKKETGTQRKKWRISFRTIQARIFFYINCIVLGVVAGAVVLYLTTTSYNMRINYVATSNQLAKIISSRLDDLMRQTDFLQVRLLESDVVREYVFEGFSAKGAAEDIYTKQIEFEKTIFALSGYDYPFYNLSIYTLDGNLIHFGRQYDFELDYELAPAQQDYLDTIIQNRGTKHIAGLDVPKFYTEEPAVSISRAFSRYYLNDPRAVIEIEISHKTLDNTINASLHSYQNLASQVVVYDQDGGLVYPVSLTEEELAHYEAVQPDVRSVNPVQSQKELVSKYTSAYTGWTVGVVTPYAAATAGMQQYLYNALLVGLVAMLISLGISHAVAKSISSPIISIKENLLSVDLDTLSNVHSGVKTNYDELELLQNAMDEMQEKLESSLNDYVQMRSLSIQSRLLALQSQMNPHFLYNTLSIMAILAEENDDVDVSDMCRKLVAMLRYSSTEREFTTLQKEVEHTRQYADLMRVRFGRNMKVAFAVEPGLEEVPMPPIILQPLVENCVKYARNPQQPLVVTVKATTHQDRWQVCVSDNGNGFSQQALAGIWQKIEQKSDWERMIQEEEKGVGLANIYMRLQLFYEDDFDFDIQNSEGGACIIVGGTIPGTGREEQDGGDEN